MNSATIAVSIQAVAKHFGQFIAIREMSFDIADNEFFTLLGPSGCGKTTLLRIIAGFESTTSGTVLLFNEELKNLPPNQRPVNTVFQNYALFPHMSVAENIGFGLHMLGWSRKDIDDRVDQMVKTVRLEEFIHRKPAQLSGGQQQRVALARAMAPKPKVLLLDEPLSALDLKLRQQMRAELKALQKETGITFIFVTHDQEEALTMSDRIAVMSAGEVQQIGTPSEVYEQPASRFVAEFIGDTNLLEASVLNKSNNQHNQLDVQLDSGESLPACAASASTLNNGTRGHLSIRPEHITLNKHNNNNDLAGTILNTTYLGTDTQYEIQLDSGVSLFTRTQNTHNQQDKFVIGNKVNVSFAANSTRFLSH